MSWRAYQRWHLAWLHARDLAAVLAAIGVLMAVVYLAGGA